MLQYTLVFQLSQQGMRHVSRYYYYAVPVSFFFVNNSMAIFIGHISYAICWTLVFRGQERGNEL